MAAPAVAATSLQPAPHPPLSTKALSPPPVFTGPCPPPRAGSGLLLLVAPGEALPTAEGSLYGHKDLSAGAPRLLEGSGFHLSATFPPHSLGPPLLGRNTQLLFFLIPRHKLLLFQLDSKARFYSLHHRHPWHPCWLENIPSTSPSMQHPPPRPGWGQPEPLAAPQGYSKGANELRYFIFKTLYALTNMPCLVPKYKTRRDTHKG